MGTPTPITITGTIRNGETTVAGRLVFASSTLVRDNASDDVMLPFEIVVDVPADGEFSQAVPATIDPGFSPSGWTIEVRPHFPHWVTPFSVSIPYNASGGTLDFSELAPVPPDGDGDLYALWNHTHAGSDHTHEIADIDDLQTQLDGKLDVPVEPYLTAADIDNLISDETFTEGMNQKADKASPTLTGTVTLGSKAPAVGLAFCGYLNLSTAPTTGTWAVGDVVETNTGPFRCTVAGTPGTWVPMWREQALDKGYVAWNGDPGQSVQAGLIVPTGGLSFIFRLRALGALISKIQMHCSTTATGITNAWCTLHDDNGLILNANAKSNANQNTAFNSGGMKDFTFIAPQVVTPGAFYRARVWFTTGTSLPTISRMCNSSTAIINPDITGTAASTPYGWASADSGLTDLTSAPNQIGNLTGIGTAWWMGAK